VTTDAQKHFTTFPEALLAPTITIIIIINILKIKFKKNNNNKTEQAADRKCQKYAELSAAA